jgi:hypothetical protein
MALLCLMFASSCLPSPSHSSTCPSCSLHLLPPTGSGPAAGTHCHCLLRIPHRNCLCSWTLSSWPMPTVSLQLQQLHQQLLLNCHCSGFGSWVPCCHYCHQEAPLPTAATADAQQNHMLCAQHCHFVLPMIRLGFLLLCIYHSPEGSRPEVRA